MLGRISCICRALLYNRAYIAAAGTFSVAAKNVARRKLYNARTMMVDQALPKGFAKDLSKQNKKLEACIKQLDKLEANRKQASDAGKKVDEVLK